MNIKTLTLTVAATAAATFSAYAEPYRVTVPVSAEANGTFARLTDYDTGAVLDSVKVADGVAVFTGEIDEPILARVTVEGERLPGFILESGSIARGKEGDFFGSMLNDQLRDFGRQMQAISAEFKSAADDAQREKIYSRYTAALDSATTANADNVLGLFYFLQGDAAQLDAQALRQQLTRYPDFAKSKRVQGMLANAEKREATSPGHKYLDFEVAYDGKTTKLSDMINPEHYTLVDFWASWCGPCIRQTKVLKDLYSKYRDKGLDVVGVAVWDEPDDTKRAIGQHSLPWPCIINAGQIPTDLYGITGIPCIILIAPDGTILSRDKQGDELVADVEAALGVNK